MFQFKSQFISAAKNGNILLSKTHAFMNAKSLQSTRFFGQKCGGNILSFNSKAPLAQSIRWASFDIKRAKIPHKAKALVLELTYEKFKYPLEGLPVSETCINAVEHKYVKQPEVSPYEKILARECLEEIEAGKMLFVIHMHPCKSDELFEQRVLLHRNNMKWLYYPETISQLAFTGTKYENLVPLYTTSTYSIISYEDDFKKFQSIERRLPSMLLLAVVAENRILSVSEFKAAAQLPSLPLMRATLLSTLTAQQQQLTRQLNAHQVDLTASLKRYVNQPVEGAETS